jgi:hypothetical protein
MKVSNKSDIVRQELDILVQNGLEDKNINETDGK